MSSTVAPLTHQFFKDLKRYNTTNFKTVRSADLDGDDCDGTILKSFSSVITRYFIFCERHARDINQQDLRMLYFMLKLDMIARFFAEYPIAPMDELKAFQMELRRFANDDIEEVTDGADAGETATTVPNLGLATA